MRDTIQSERHWRFLTLLVVACLVLIWVAPKMVRSPFTSSAWWPVYAAVLMGIAGCLTVFLIYKNGRPFTLRRAISLTHLLCCVGWSLFGFVVLIGSGNDIAIAIIVVIPTIFTIAASGIYLFIVGREKHRMISFIHLLCCIGWSFVGFGYLIETCRYVYESATLAPYVAPALTIITIFTTTASGIYLFVVGREKNLVLLWSGVVIIILMCIFPPTNDGYMFIGDVPDGINFARLALQFVLAGVIVGGIVLTRALKKDIGQSSQTARLN